MTDHQADIAASLKTIKTLLFIIAGMIFGFALRLAFIAPVGLTAMLLGR